MKSDVPAVGGGSLTSTRRAVVKLRVNGRGEPLSDVKKQWREMKGLAMNVRTSAALWIDNHVAVRTHCVAAKHKVNGVCVIGRDDFVLAAV